MNENLDNTMILKKDTMIFAVIFFVFHIFILDIVETGAIQHENYFINKQIYLETIERDKMKQGAIFISIFYSYNTRNIL